MSQQDLILARAIAKYPCLYDTSQGNGNSWRVSLDRVQAWQDISQMIGIDENECKLRWKNMRSNFSRTNRRMALDGNQSRPASKTPLFKLLKTLLTRQGSGSSGAASQSGHLEPWNEGARNFDHAQDDEDDDEDNNRSMESIRTNPVKARPAPPPISSSSSYNPGASANMHWMRRTKVALPQMIKGLSGDTKQTSVKPVQMVQNKRALDHGSPPPSAILREALKAHKATETFDRAPSMNDQNCQETNEQVREEVEKQVAPQSEPPSQQAESVPEQAESDVDLILKSVAITIRSLPPRMVIQAKLDLIRVITNLEHEAAANHGPTTSATAPLPHYYYANNYDYYGHHYYAHQHHHQYPQALPTETPQASVPVFQQETPQASVPVHLPETPQTSVPVNLPETPQTSVPVHLPETPQTSVPVHLPETPQASVPVLPRETPQASVPVLKPKTPLTSVPVLPRETSQTLLPEKPQVSKPELSPETQQIFKTELKPETPQIAVPVLPAQTPRTSTQTLAPETQISKPELQQETPQVSKPELQPEEPKTSTIPELSHEVMDAPKLQPQKPETDVPESAKEVQQTDPVIPVEDVPKRVPEVVAAEEKTPPSDEVTKENEKECKADDQGDHGGPKLPEKDEDENENLPFISDYFDL